MRWPLTASLGRRARHVAAVAAATALAVPAPASAHGLVGRAEVPIPEWLFAWAVCAVLVGSALVLRRSPDRSAPSPERVLLVLPRAVEPVLGLLGVAVLAVGVWAGFTGVQDAQRNLLPDLVFVGFWVGVPVVSLIVGDWFSLLSPWRAVARGAGWVVSRTLGEPPAAVGYPARLGRWPAAVGILAFGWVELVCDSRDSPQLLATLACGYVAAMLLGSCLFGERAWTRNADPFAVYFAMLASLAPLRLEGGRVLLGAPLRGARGAGVPRGALALVAVAVGTTTFDGLTNSVPWAAIAPNVLEALHRDGLDLSTAATVVYTGGLLLSIVVIGAMVQLIRRRKGEGVELTLSLTPIIAGYLVAHYASLLVTRGQDLGYLVSDPRGTGADVFGTAGMLVDYGLLSATAIFYVQVGAVLLGHFSAVVLGHRACVHGGGAPTAMGAQERRLLVLAIALSCLALWLLNAVSLG